MSGASFVLEEALSSIEYCVLVLHLHLGLDRRLSQASEGVSSFVHDSVRNAQILSWPHGEPKAMVAAHEQKQKRSSRKYA